jgi:prevent-host-death family protein
MYRKDRIYKLYATGMAEEIPVTQARADFADLVNRVVYGGERIVMTRHGKPLVALVSAEDLERLEQLDQGLPARNVVRMTRSGPGATERRLDIASPDQPPGGGATPRY